MMRGELEEAYPPLAQRGQVLSPALYKAISQKPLKGGITEAFDDTLAG